MGKDVSAEIEAAERLIATLNGDLEAAVAKVRKCGAESDTAAAREAQSLVPRSEDEIAVQEARLEGLRPKLGLKLRRLQSRLSFTEHRAGIASARRRLAGHHDVFLSYSRNDLEAATNMFGQLEKVGAEIVPRPGKHPRWRALARPPAAARAGG